MHPSTGDSSTAPASPTEPDVPLRPDPAPGQESDDAWAAPPVFRRYLGEPGAQVHLYEGGSEEGRPVVLLHRSAATAHGWVPTLRLGSWDARVLAPDLPGAGLSDPFRGDDEALAWHLLHALRGTERRGALVVVDGDAARLGIELALAGPQAVAGLVLLAPPVQSACEVERLRHVRQPVWAAAGADAPGAQTSLAEVPGARWLTLPGIGAEPVTEHPDLLLDLVHGALAELASTGRPQDGRRYITWVSSEACENPSLSR